MTYPALVLMVGAGLTLAGCEPKAPGLDADADGFASGSGPDGDCDDDNAAVHPGAYEVCNGVDDDCDGSIDGADAIDAADTWPDADGDSYGASGAAAQRGCASPGWVTRGDDCDDANAAVHPEAEEGCNDLDDDCDGTVDGPDATDAVTVWPDDDRDGYGSASAAAETRCATTGWVENGDDCDDADPGSHPAAPEGCDGLDSDCDGVADRDDPDVDPSSVPDQWADVDGDGYGDAGAPSDACEAEGVASNGEDCDDLDPFAYPGARESCDTVDVDEDCDGSPASGAGLLCLSGIGTTADGAALPGLRLGSPSIPELEDDLHGATPARVGDIDGDGADDLVFGTKFSSFDGNTLRGAVTAVDLEAAGLLRADLRTVGGALGLYPDAGAEVVYGVDNYDYFGALVVGVGDLDGDGLGEVLVGSYDMDPAGIAGAGEVVLFYGSPNGLIDGPSPSGRADSLGDAFLQGSGAYEGFGWSACTTDLDADGYPEVAVSSAPLEGSGRVNLFEHVTRWGSGAPLSSATDATSVLVDDHLRLHLSPSCSGDFDADGYPDLVIADSGSDPDSRDDAGSVHVVLGGPEDGLLLDLHDATARIRTFDGELAYDGVAFASFVGDFDGDGVDDVAVGGGAVSGTAYVLYGGESYGRGQDLADQPGLGRGVALRAPAADGIAQVASPGDVNADGCDDLLVSAKGLLEPGDDKDAIGRGGAYVVFGAGACSSSTRITGDVWLDTLDDPIPDAAGVRIVGEVNGDEAGVQVSAAGDLDGDALPDLFLLSLGHVDASALGLVYGVLGSTLVRGP